MRWHVGTAYTLPLMVMVLGCEKTPKDRLQGRWLGEAVENVPAAQQAKAAGWVRGTAFEFAGSRVTVTIPAEAPRSGSFRVTRVDGDRVVVSFQRQEGGHDEVAFRFADGGSLEWDVGDGRRVVLVKSTN